MVQCLTVDLGERSYPIYVGSGLLQQSELLTQHISGKQVFVVTNETIAPLYLNALLNNLTGYEVNQLILPDGEVYKTLDTISLIYDGLLENRHNRTTTVIALGGGVIGDMTGFAAASYQRGVNFIQIPTTLLSQVDSSVGGKTGVNHALGKNMIGAFHQPQCVIADTDTLTTLPEREFAAGLAEVVKYGALGDRDFLHWLDNNLDALLKREQQILIPAILRSCQCKKDIVDQDELEGGVRALLNLGHTFGHAIETARGYGNWLHGEAVATGMVMAADLSVRQGWLSSQEALFFKALLQRCKLPVAPPEDITTEQFLALMGLDKKVIDGKLRLILLKSLGQAIITSQFDKNLLLQTLGCGPQLCENN